MLGVKHFIKTQKTLQPFYRLPVWPADFPLPLCLCQPAQKWLFLNQDHFRLKPAFCDRSLVLISLSASTSWGDDVLKTNTLRLCSPVWTSTLAPVLTLWASVGPWTPPLCLWKRDHKVPVVVAAAAAAAARPGAVWVGHWTAAPCWCAEPPGYLELFAAGERNNSWFTHRLKHNTWQDAGQGWSQ